jgi:hypothetical protein
MRVGFGTVAEQDMLAIAVCQVKWQVGDKRETLVIHTGEACKWIRPHKSERMDFIFGIELRGQIHTPWLFLVTERCDFVAV